MMLPIGCMQDNLSKNFGILLKIFFKEKLTHLPLQDSSSASQLDTVDVCRGCVITQMCHVDDPHLKGCDSKS